MELISKTTSWKRFTELDYHRTGLEHTSISAVGWASLLSNAHPTDAGYEIYTQSYYIQL